MFESHARRLALAALLVAPASSVAQQYVWSVPSADVLGPGRWLLEGYAYGGLQGSDAWSLGPRVTFGLGHRLEAGVNLTANLTPAFYLSAGYVLGNTGVSAGNHYFVAALSWFPRGS